MKAITKRSFIGLHLATLATLTIIISLPLLAISIAHAESSLNLSSGLSYINQQNLQSNQATTLSGTSTTARTGWQVGISGGWQQMATNSRYAINAQASLDRGFNSADDIRSAALEGSWMRALSRNWLAHIRAQIGDYQDGDQPAYNSRTIGGGLTLGWFGPRNSGLDLNSDWQAEQYNDDPAKAYGAERYTLGSRYYFAHRNSQAYWSVGIVAGRFDADQMPGYSYDTINLKLAYNAWHWKQLKGTLQLQWRNNRFDATPVEMASMTPTSPPSVTTGMVGMNPLPSMSGNPSSPQTEAQNDTYLTTSLRLTYPLGKLWQINTSLNVGRYRSNVAESRPLLSGYVGMSVRCCYY